MPIARKSLSTCPIERGVSILGGRWKTMLVYHLLDGPIRYAQLRRKLTDCAERVLLRQLRELERDGIVSRRQLGGKPPQVQYALTPLGLSIRPVFDALFTWGEAHRQHTSSLLFTPASHQPMHTKKTLAHRPPRTG